MAGVAGTLEKDAKSSSSVAFPELVVAKDELGVI